MGRYLLERKAVSWSRLGARYCVRLEMRYLIFVQSIVNIKIISVCRDGSGPSVNIPIIVTSLMSRRATNPVHDAA